MGSFQTFPGNRWKRTQLKELDSGRGTSNNNGISISSNTSDSNSTRNRHGNDKQ